MIEGRTFKLYFSFAKVGQLSLTGCPHLIQKASPGSSSAPQLAHRIVEEGGWVVTFNEIRAVRLLLIINQTPNAPRMTTIPIMTK
jgi:hypothetical protein